MSTEQIAFARGLIAVLAVLLWFYGPWQALVVEWARQGVLELRDVWFDATVPGGPHRNPAEARTVLHACDALIEGMERLSLPGILAIHAWLRAYPPAASGRTLSVQVCAIADQSLRRLALRTIDRAGHCVAAQTFARSLLTLPYGLFLMVRAELLRSSALRPKASILGNRRIAREQSPSVCGGLIRRELEIAAAISNDPFLALYLRRGLPAHGGR